MAKLYVNFELCVGADVELSLGMWVCLRVRDVFGAIVLLLE